MNADFKGTHYGSFTLKVIYYSFIKSQFVPEFVGFKNYVSTMNNQYFRLA